MQGGLICKKKEMMRVFVDEVAVPVTLLEILPQEIVGYRTQEKDGYVAVILGSGKKEIVNKNGKKISSYRIMREFPVDTTWMQQHQIGEIIEGTDDITGTKVTVVSVSKGKGFQGVMKRCNAHGGPKTHGSKFHRTIGSMGNRKPRRVMKGHPGAGQMGNAAITLHKVPVVRLTTFGETQLIAIKGSVPGGYNTVMYLHR